MIWFYVILTVLLAFAYALLITFILKEWQSIPEIVTISYETSNAGLTIIIPARNEESNILNCLPSILANDALDQMHIQILVIDDHSEDSTAELVDGLKDKRVRCIRLEDYLEQENGIINAYKKAAINVGLELSEFDYIIQLDADTTVPQAYLRTVQNTILNSEPAFIAGPIIFNSTDSLIEKFQQLDIMGMMAVTAAGINSRKWYMANGANMIYKKINHQFDTQSYASGDDVFTIQQVAAETPQKVLFLKSKEAIVKTNSAKSFKSLYQQRLRWATKNKSMKGLNMQMMMAIPFLNAVLILAHFISFIFVGNIAFILLAFHLSIKCFSDYLLLNEMSQFFGQEKIMKSFLVSNLLHIVYIALIGVLSLFVKNYEWKGRRVN